MVQKRIRINTFIDYDLVITYERSHQEHGRISGHFFEAFDYWLHLSSYTNKKIAILILDDISEERIKEAYEDKYLIPSRDGVGYEFDTIPIFVDPFTITVACKNILHTSGLSKTDEVGYFGNLVSFRCAGKPTEDNYILLQDTRIYTDNPKKPLIIDYNKKIPFEFYRRFEDMPRTNKILIYDNTVLRKTKKDYSSEDFLVVGSDLKLPVKDFMLKFDEYWYTPTKKKFDCSSRLIAECAFYGKKVRYEVPDGYMELDTGLFFRRYDAELDFRNLVLAEGDPIQNFIFGGVDGTIQSYKTNNS